MTDGSLWGAPPPGMGVVEAREAETRAAAQVLAAPSHSLPATRIAILPTGAVLVAEIVAQVRASGADTVFAEGSGRNHNKEFIQFLGIANGSTFELITQLILAKRLKLANEELIQPIINQLVEVSNMNFAFQKH